MKGKFIVLSLFALTISVATYAFKPIQLGVKAGATWQNVDLGRAVSGNYDFLSNSKMGMQFGVVGRINLLMLHLQPELLYSMNRYELTANPTTGAGGSRSIVKVNSFDLPVLLGFKLLFIRINAGPVFNLMNDVSVKSKAGEPASVLMSRSAVSYMAGLGVDVGKFAIDARYHGEFKKVRQSIHVAGMDKAMSNKGKFGNMVVSLGYMF